LEDIIDEQGMADQQFVSDNTHELLEGTGDNLQFEN
jgi:hypothetical protein